MAEYSYIYTSGPQMRMKELKCLLTKVTACIISMLPLQNLHYRQAIKITYPFQGKGYLSNLLESFMEQTTTLNLSYRSKTTSQTSKRDFTHKILSALELFVNLLSISCKPLSLHLLL
jgi:hypothetical protein